MDTERVGSWTYLLQNMIETVLKTPFIFPVEKSRQTWKTPENYNISRLCRRIKSQYMPLMTRGTWKAYYGMLLFRAVARLHVRFLRDAFVGLNYS